MILGNIKSHDPFFVLWSIPKTRSRGETEVIHHNYTCTHTLTNRQEVISTISSTELYAIDIISLHPWPYFRYRQDVSLYQLEFQPLLHVTFILLKEQTNILMSCACSHDKEENYLAAADYCL